MKKPLNDNLNLYQKFIILIIIYYYNEFDESNINYIYNYKLLLNFILSKYLKYNNINKLYSLLYMWLF